MNPSDREIIISIVTNAFEQNPRVMSMVKKKDPSRNVRLMTEYAYQLVEKFNGVYLSADKTTVLFYYLESQYKRTFIDYLKYGKMFMKAIRPSQLMPTLKREKHIKSLRYDYEDFIYVWILGSDPNKTSIRGLADIRNHLFGLSEKLQLPILIETTVEKVRKLYHYVGFEEYHKWEDNEAGIDVWFMERKVQAPKRV
ncbi:MAG: hypothetical protein DRI97_01445 [Bacteroidetes bacterium]|nr:MAG: hypothetical protein DRI97_01445 [Bacteroidota bacterium]RLD71021.1 MAG: hypothetical protein DRI98_06415 [Bacteroidota bacterium]RLD96223.1 MAG: hypothetical protein DRJ29_00540 [Bacteroidota bacterium]